MNVAANVPAPVYSCPFGVIRVKVNGPLAMNGAVSMESGSATLSAAITSVNSVCSGQCVVTPFGSVTVKSKSFTAPPQEITAVSPGRQGSRYVPLANPEDWKHTI